MSFRFEHHWIVAILVISLTGRVWWLMGKPYRDREAGLTAGYRRLIRGLLIWGNIPWLIMGAGMLFGGVPSIDHFMDLKSSNPFVLCWLASVGFVWAGGTYWIFARRGAEQLVRHPGLIPFPMVGPFMVKFMWLILCACGALAVVTMLFQATTPLMIQP